MDEKLVSVIIPTRNSAATIADCLISVRQQTYGNIEIIVVDNNATSDETKNISSQFTNNLYSFGPERNNQRNFGAAHANGDYLVFIDSDMKLEKDVIKDCVHVMDHPNVVGVIIPEISFGSGFWAQCKRFERSFYVGVRWIEAARFVSRAVYDCVGGYNENLISGEDWYFSQQVEKLGKIGRIDASIYHNEGKPTFGGMMKKKYYYAKHIDKYYQLGDNPDALSRQCGVLERVRIYFRKPGILLREPHLALGMLFMKMSEYIVGKMALVSMRFRS